MAETKTLATLAASISATAASAARRLQTTVVQPGSDESATSPVVPSTRNGLSLIVAKLNLLHEQTRNIGTVVSGSSAVIAPELSEVLQRILRLTEQGLDVVVDGLKDEKEVDEEVIKAFLTGSSGFWSLGAQLLTMATKEQQKQKLESHDGREIIATAESASRRVIEGGLNPVAN
ncbi:hypothetical protein QBC35DRAFT_497621 [Podospora australis]|uniref:Uncharacterized protein n=1 Tax=Podospora australis TaxID=1536484 RepID=A0AAN6WUT1_9PEZI|nr:hypothetical protein QBC35DRAFT_497621 [Podospora australis]